MRIAIATNNTYPELVGGEKLLLEAFRKKYYATDTVAWDDPSVDWSNYDAVIVRVCWGYYQKIPQFLAWLQKLDDLDVNTQNTSEIIRWNVHKKYLIELADRGVNIPPTTLIKKDDPRPLQSILAAFDSEDFVIKPCYGAAAFGIMRTPKKVSNDTAAAYTDLVQKCDVLIQSFIPAIKNGEISAIFIDSTFSHAVIKVPKNTDFRSNSEYGGSEKKAQLTPKNIANLTSIYKDCGIDALYARLDVIMDKDKVYVIELELIEPYLYFDLNESSADRFVQAYAKK